MTLETPTRRRFIWGEHPLAEAAFGVIGSVALAGWLVIGMGILIVIDERDGPEAMGTLAVAFTMPPALLVAFGFSAIAALVWHTFWGGRVSRVVGVVAAFAAVITPLSWIAIIL